MLQAKMQSLYQDPIRFHWKKRKKKVKKGYLEARTIYEVKKFDIERRRIINGISGGTWQKCGKGNAKKPYGVDFHRYVTYK